MINIAKLLKDTPKGMKLYSPLIGEVEFAEVMDTSYMPIRVMRRGYGIRFDKYGRYSGEYPDAECLLFPSKDCRTWEGWKAPKPHYGIKNFKPFDKVLVRDCCEKWGCELFSLYEETEMHPFITCASAYKQCIPFEGNEHLLGTTDVCSEEYINW